MSIGTRVGERIIPLAIALGVNAAILVPAAIIRVNVCNNEQIEEYQARALNHLTNDKFQRIEDQIKNSNVSSGKKVALWKNVVDSIQKTDTKDLLKYEKCLRIIK